ncbi:MAG: RNA polymerase sigma factor [Kordiimonadaceae bacterium]|nr:RNA polymerase sigma factor [Kordiimonadaceae bacterium]
MSKVFVSFSKNESALKRYLGRFFTRAQDIEDIAQETFLKAFASEINTEVRSPKSFLFKIAKNTALKEIAKRANRTTDFIEDSIGMEQVRDAQYVSPEEEIDSRRKLLVFTKAVANLPPKCRQAFLMRKVDGLRVKDVARALDISVSGVEKHIALGLVKCSQYFREQGLNPSDFGTSLPTHSKPNRTKIATLIREENDKS